MSLETVSFIAMADGTAEDAARRDRPLHIVHAFVWPAVYAPMAAPLYASYEDGMREVGEGQVVEIGAVAGGEARIFTPPGRVSYGRTVHALSLPVLTDRKRTPPRNARTCVDRACCVRTAAFRRIGPECPWVARPRY